MELLILIVKWLVSIAGSAGFLLSLWTWIHTLNAEKVKLHLEILKTERFNNRTVLHLSIENESAKPVAINRISVWHDDDWLKCEPIPEAVSSGDSTCSTSIPIYLPSYGAVQCRCLFRGLPSSALQDRSTLTLRFCTNRRKRPEFELDIPLQELRPRSGQW